LWRAEGASLRSGFAAGDGLDPGDRAVEREDLSDSSRLGVRNEIRLGKIEPVELVDLEGPEQYFGVDGVDRRERDRRRSARSPTTSTR
jgi:hypothetical protein